MEVMKRADQVLNLIALTNSLGSKNLLENWSSLFCYHNSLKKHNKINDGRGGFPKVHTSNPSKNSSKISSAFYW